MPRQLVQTTISIHARAETVWHIITNSALNVKWLAAFGEGNIAQTDWKEGSKAVFVDGSGTGLIATILESRPHEKIRIQNIGLITDDTEDYDSPEALESHDFFEQYVLTSEGDVTTLNVEVHVEDAFYEEMSDCWERALLIIKELAESGEV